MRWMNLSEPVDIDGRKCDQALIDDEDGADLRPGDVVRIERDGSASIAFVADRERQQVIGTVIEFGVSRNMIQTSAPWRKA